MAKIAIENRDVVIDAATRIPTESHVVPGSHHNVNLLTNWPLVPW